MGIIFDIRAFMYNPTNVYITIGAISLSLLFFLFLKFNTHASNKQKLFLTYGHIFSLIFPIVYFMYSTGCRMLFSGCHTVQAITYISFMAIISGLVTAILVAPFFLFNNFRKKSMEIRKGNIAAFVARQARKLKIKKPSIYILDSAKPVAFSFTHIKKTIFISLGMYELLSKKELESVILHELAHIKRNSASLKLSEFALKILSPLGKFASFGRAIDTEEMTADNYAISVQGTARHLKSAQRKLEEFHSCI